MSAAATTAVAPAARQRGSASVPTSAAASRVSPARVPSSRTRRPCSAATRASSSRRTVKVAEGVEPSR
nr:hypothetical protein [Pseudonocardia alni]